MQNDWLYKAVSWGEDRAQGKRELRDNTGIESEDVSRQKQDTSSSILKGLAWRRVTTHGASLEPRSCQGGRRERSLGRTTQLGTREL